MKVRSRVNVRMRVSREVRNESEKSVSDNEHDK